MIMYQKQISNVQKAVSVIFLICIICFFFTEIKGKERRYKNLTTPFIQWYSNNNYKKFRDAPSCFYIDKFFLKLNINNCFRRLKISYKQGTAYVKSLDKKTAKGEDKFQGMEVTLRPPYSTGWKGLTFSVFPKYVNQSILIKDLIVHIPQVTVSGKTSIPVIISDFNTGMEISLNDPNIYDMSYQSLGVSFEIGKNFTKEFESIKTLFEAYVGSSFVEWSTTSIKSTESSSHRDKWEYFKNYNAGIRLVMYIPSTRMSVELEYTNFLYPKLELPQSLDFRSSEIFFNSKKEIFERKRVYIKEVEFSTTEILLSLNFIF